VAGKEGRAKEATMPEQVTLKEDWQKIDAGREAG